MDKTLEVNAIYKSTQFDSFQELQDCSGHNDPFIVIVDALYTHRFYTKHVASKKNHALVVYHDRKDLCTINDEITVAHKDVAHIPLSIRESELAELSDKFNRENLGEHITRALSLYELLKQAESEGMHMGVFDIEKSMLSQCSLAFTLNHDGQTKVISSGPGYHSPYLQ